MKKLLSTIIALAISVSAFSFELTNGEYIHETVHSYEGMNDDYLFNHALFALTELSGHSMSRDCIDFQSKNAGMIVYKSTAFLGYHPMNKFYGYNVSMNYVLTIKVDGAKIKYSVRVLSMSFKWTGQENSFYTESLSNLYPNYHPVTTDAKLSESVTHFCPEIPTYCERIIDRMHESVMQPF